MDSVFKPIMNIHVYHTDRMVASVSIHYNQYTDRYIYGIVRLHLIEINSNSLKGYFNELDIFIYVAM